jgi:cell shape-determining protein MreC
MSYLLDRKLKRNKFLKISLGIVVLFFLIFFRAAIFHGFSAVTHFITRPVLFLGNKIGDKIYNTRELLRSKNDLITENESLKSQILESGADRANYVSVVDENNKMKDILGRKPEKLNLILSGILAKPNQSPYDTLIIDAGSNQGIKTEDRVFAYGAMPIGYVSEVYVNSSKVILFSNPGEKTDVVISGKDVFLQAIGRGGGNFEIILPRDFVLDQNAEVDLPGINKYILGTVATITSDPRDSFQKALVVSPVNIQELGLVEVEN